MAPSNKRTTLDPARSLLVAPHPQALPVDPDGIRFELRRVTPQYADDLLGRNHHNRTPNRKNLDKLSLAMQNGEYKTNSETIKLNPEGEVVDGQHRLIAIKDTGITQDIWFALNVPKDVVDTLDIGVPKNDADAWKTKGTIDFPKKVLPIVTLLVQAMTKPNCSFSTGIRNRVVKDHRSHIDWGVSLVRGHRDKFPAPLASAFIFAHAHPKHQDAVERLAEEYRGGVGHKEKSAALALTDLRIKLKDDHKLQFRVDMFNKVLNLIYHGCKGLPVVYNSPLATNKKGEKLPYDYFLPTWKSTADYLAEATKLKLIRQKK